MRARIAWFALLFVLTGSAGSKECTTAEAMAAEGQVDQLDTWTKVRRAYTKFGHCDDGAIAEGYSDAVSVLLARHWDRVGDLAALIEKDHRFGQFVLRHLDETMNADDLIAITRAAKERCPVGRKQLCNSILSKIESLTKDAT